MADLSFKLDENMVREALQQALITALKPEERDKLVGEAVRQLVAGSWSTPSEVNRIFARAATTVAEELARAEFAKPENTAKLEAIVVEAWQRATTGENREKLVQKASEAIGRGIFGDRY